MSKPKERRLILRDWQVRALIDGRLSQVRMPCSTQPFKQDWLWHAYYPWGEGGHGIYETEAEMQAEFTRLLRARCPLGQPGDRLWVAEAYIDVMRHERGYQSRKLGCDAEGYLYRADRTIVWEDGTTTQVPDGTPKWRPSTQMPRWDSRFTLEITVVRVERLDGIFERSILNMGATAETFVRLWDEQHGKRAPWASNPWVWVVDVKQIDTP